MLILDILFKLALIVVVLTFSGMAAATYTERRKYIITNARMAAFMGHTRTHLYSTVETMLDGWLRHDANCAIHTKPASRPCSCGLYDAMMALKSSIDADAATPR